MKVLVVDDEPVLASTLSIGLRAEGFLVVESSDGVDGLWLAVEHNFDVVVLDIMLPGLDGFTIGQRLKKAAPTAPLLLLSARTAVDDKLQGLQFADDYVTKPFHIDELAARIEVLLRRSGAAMPDQIKLGQHLSVDLTGNTIRDERTGDEVILTGTQHQILMYFLRHPEMTIVGASPSAR